MSGSRKNETANVKNKSVFTLLTAAANSLFESKPNPLDRCCFPGIADGRISSGSLLDTELNSSRMNLRYSCSYTADLYTSQNSMRRSLELEGRLYGNSSIGNLILFHIQVFLGPYRFGTVKSQLAGHVQ